MTHPVMTAIGAVLDWVTNQLIGLLKNVCVATFYANPAYTGLLMLLEKALGIKLSPAEFCDLNRLLKLMEDAMAKAMPS